MRSWAELSDPDRRRDEFDEVLEFDEVRPVAVSPVEVLPSGFPRFLTEAERAVGLAHVDALRRQLEELRAAREGGAR